MCAPSVPDTSAAQEYAVNAQKDISEKELALQDKMLTYFQGRQDKLDPLQEQVTQSQINLANETASQGHDLYEYQKSVFRPVEQSLVTQAMQDSTPEYYQKYAAQAAATIGAQQQAAQGAFERNMASMGVNPNSGAYGAGARGLQLATAAQRSAGMNDAFDRAEALGWARRADVAGLGKGLVGAGNASYGLAMQGNTSALSGANDTTRTAATTMGTPTQYGQMGMQAGMNMGTLANDIYRSQVAANQQSGDVWGALGSAVGGWASSGFAM